MSEADEDGQAADPPVAGWMEKMRAFFAASGEPVPDEIAGRHPYVFVGSRDNPAPPDDFARRVVEILRGRNLLFRRGLELGTVDESGTWHEMTVDRVRTWLPAVAAVIPFKATEKADGKPIKAGIPYDLARAFLASDELWNKCPEIRLVNLVRMPVLRDELDERGKRKIELLPLGYDAASKIYTVHQTPDFDEHLDPNEGFKFLDGLLKYFAFSDESRLAVQIAAMLTVYVRGLYSGRSPMFLWNSNLAGSGKSRLSQLALDPVFGDAGKSGYSFDSGDEVRKELDAAAQAFAPYIWFDDVPKGTVRNTDLNRWLTAKTWQCRVLGSKAIFKGPVFASTFMTGAQIELDSMISRRTLVVDLFPREKSRNRQLPEDAVPINDAFFENEDTRGKVLAALWSLVRWWDERGRPGMKECPELAGESPLESFESWSEIVPPIVATVSFGNCLRRFEAPDAGDTETREFEKLAELLIRKHCEGREAATVTMEDVVAAARLAGLFVEHLGALEDVVRDLERMKGWTWDFPDEIDEMTGEEGEKAALEWKRQRAAGWTDKRLQSSWGKRFRKSAVSGQYFRFGGDVWEFGTRETSRKSAFPITKVKPAVPKA